MAGFTMEYTTTGASESVTLPLVTGYTYDCQVIWDGEPPVSVTEWDDADATHVQATAGTYQVEITGICPAWSVNNTHSSKLKWTGVVYWGDAVDFTGFGVLTGGFFGCSNLATIGAGRIIAASGLQSLSNCFYFCSSLTSNIPTGMFDYCYNVINVSGLFANSGITGQIPSGLFSACPLQQAQYCFYECTGLTLKIPSALFNHPGIVNLYRAFYGCNNLVVSPWIYYADGQQSTRFLNKTVNLSGAHQSSASTSQGQAPDLWNCAGTLTGTDCFSGAGNSLASLINYNNIPTAWGGPATTTPPLIDSGPSQVRSGMLVALSGTDFETAAYPASYTLTTGTHISGSVADLQATDGTYLKIREVGGVPGFDITLEYTGILAFDAFTAYLMYSGIGQTHTVHCRLYNFDTTTWDEFASMQNSSVVQRIHFGVPNGADYIDGSGNVRVNFYHDESGTASHSIDFDYAAIDVEGSLYLCDANNLATADTVEQIITNDETSIEIDALDIGTFPPGDYWLYFVDSDDQISQGWEIELLPDDPHTNEFFVVSDFDVPRIDVAFESAPSSSGLLTVTKKSAAGEDFDTVIRSYTPTGSASMAITGLRGFVNGDKVRLDYANPDGLEVASSANINIVR